MVILRPYGLCKMKLLVGVRTKPKGSENDRESMSMNKLDVDGGIEVRCRRNALLATV